MDGTEIVAQQPEGCKGPFRTGGRSFTLEGSPPVLWSPFLAVLCVRQCQFVVIDTTSESVLCMKTKRVSKVPLVLWSANELSLFNSLVN